VLEHIYFEVDRLNSQIPRNKRGDTFKSEQLMSVVENRIWAQEGKKKLRQGIITFSQLYSEISASALIWEESTRKRGMDPDVTTDLQDGLRSKDLVAATLHYGARYANSAKPSNYQSAHSSTVRISRVIHRHSNVISLDIDASDTISLVIMS